MPNKSIHPSKSAVCSRAVLLLVCRDQPGIVARVTDFIFQQGGNIVSSDQHTDLETGTFLMRVEWELEGFCLSRKQMELKIQGIAAHFQMDYQLYCSTDQHRMAIFVSKFSHCLYDLLMRYRLGEFSVESLQVISNHRDLKPVADHFEVPFHFVPIDSKDKGKGEKLQREILEKHQIDFIVLARYMQVLSPEFVSAYPDRMINIHHSFLPAFIGGKPYHQAYARGVKIIGATSHYVTEELDQGPIIHQAVARVSHRDRVEDLIRKGREQEQIALAHAVRMHLEHRVLRYGNKTVVFE